MPAEHGSVQPGALRREHIVAAAMVAAVTVVLGFASGFGVRDAGAAVGLPVNPAPPVATQPGGQPVVPPLAGPLPPGAGRPIGSPVGLRPGTAVTPGSPSTPGSVFHPEAGSAAGLGDFPMAPPAAPAYPSPPSDGSVAAPPPECQPGILDSLLALLSAVLGGTTPAPAMVDAGAVPMQSEAPVVAGIAPDVPVLLPVHDGAVLVSGLLPLLDTVSQWEVAQRTAAPQETAAQQGPRPAGSLIPAGPAPAGSAPAAAEPADQLAQLAALLAPVGLFMDPGTGLADPMLVPVLGSLGCGGIVPAAPPGAVQ